MKTKNKYLIIAGIILLIGFILLMYFHTQQSYLTIRQGDLTLPAVIMHENWNSLDLTITSSYIGTLTSDSHGAYFGSRTDGVDTLTNTYDTSNSLIMSSSLAGVKGGVVKENYIVAEFIGKNGSLTGTVNVQATSPGTAPDSSDAAVTIYSNDKVIYGTGVHACDKNIDGCQGPESLNTNFNVPIISGDKIKIELITGKNTNGNSNANINVNFIENSTPINTCVPACTVNQQCINMQCIDNPKPFPWAMIIIVSIIVIILLILAFLVYRKFK
jgi:hypothetical protein